MDDKKFENTVEADHIVPLNLKLKESEKISFIKFMENCMLNQC